MTLGKTSGFTLIEVLFVSLFLFGISLATFTAIRATTETKKTIDLRSEILQSGRAVLSLFSRDIRNVYFVDATDLGWNPPETKTREQWIEEGKKENEITEEMTTPPPPKPVPITLFQGNANELLFSSRTHQRLSADTPENIEHFVRYRLDSDSLIREETYRAINKEDISEDDQWRDFTVIESVNNFDLEYYDDKTERWTNEWDTNSSSHLDRLPKAVKIKLVYTPEGIDDAEIASKQVTYETSVMLLERQFRERALKNP